VGRFVGASGKEKSPSAERTDGRPWGETDGHGQLAGEQVNKERGDVANEQDLPIKLYDKQTAGMP